MLDLLYLLLQGVMAWLGGWLADHKITKFFLVAVMLAIFAGSVFLIVTSNNTATFFLGIGGAISLGAISVAVLGAQMTRSRRRRQSLQARVDDILADGQGDGNLFAKFAEFGVAVLAGLADAKLAAEDLRLAAYTAERAQAEQELATHLPANPRRAKRLVNHERLYAQIAKDRGIFGGEPDLTRSHLAKWVIIVEHSPRLGAALTRDPSKISEIEHATTVAGLQETMNRIAPGVRATDGLLQMLTQGVALSPILARLVRFEASIPLSETGGPNTISSQDANESGSYLNRSRVPGGSTS